jgi:protein SCO1/2/putative membrane protein
MSTNGSEGSPACESSIGRHPWLWAGGLLWGLVAIALVTAWQASRQQRLAAEQAREEGLENAALDSNSPARIVLPVSQSGGEEQVIDISNLLSKGGNADDVPMWSPDGIEDFSLTNMDGRTITKAALLGRPWAVCFVFTKCLGPCPRVTQQLKALQDRLKKSDIRLVTLTVDPARDTPEVLQNYAKLNGADPERWYFLSGDQAAIYRLIQHSFRMPVQEVNGPNRQEGFEVIHSTNVMLVDRHGVVQGKFNAAKDEEMVSLRRELQKLADPMPIADSTATESEPPVADAGSGR